MNSLVSKSGSFLDRLTGIDRLSIYFCLAYLMQGVSCAQFGLVRQPVQFFMMSGLKLSAADVSNAFALLMLPWILKPIYGLLSDSVPIFGSRRKSYLILAYLAGSCSLLGLACAQSAGAVVIWLALCATFMAISTTMMVAVAVESGREGGRARHYFRVQEFSFYAASIPVAAFAGYLCDNLIPSHALRAASIISAIPLFLLALLTLKGLKEAPGMQGNASISNSISSLVTTFRSKAVLVTFGFTMCWAFNPAFGVPLYFWESQHLHFSQSDIGLLSAWMALGMMVGAICSAPLCRVFKPRQQALITSGLLLVGTVGYFWLGSFVSAIVLEFFRGLTTLLSIICMHGLAADRCRHGSEATIMALLLAVLNLTTYASNYLGGLMYSHVFNEQFSPLIAISAIGPIVSLGLLGYLDAQEK